MTRYELHNHICVEIAQILSDRYGEPFEVAVGDHPCYDLCSYPIDLQVEVKCESTPIRTGNVAIEYWNTDFNRESGVVETGANVWIHLVPDGDSLLAIEYDVAVLRKLVIEEGVVKSNGRNSLCKIIPIEVFKKYARSCFVFESHFAKQILGSGEMSS